MLVFELNICYVAVDVVLPAPTGGATHTLEMARALSEHGNNVYVVSRREKGQSKNVKVNAINIQRIYRLIFFATPLGEEENTHFDEVKHPRLTGLYHLYLKTVYALYSSIKVARLVRKYNIHVIIERASSLGAGAIAARLTRRPLIVEVITGTYASLSLRTATRILAYSMGVLPGWVPRSKVIQVTAAVNTRVFNPTVDGKKVREKYALANKPVVAYCGGFWEYHGIETLIEASKEVIAEHPQVFFLMIGPGYKKYESYARSRGVADHFVFTGSIPHEEVPYFLAAADILIAPYFPKEHTGSWLRHSSSSGTLKLVEYHALQKPVIASKIPPIESFIKDGVTGILVPPGDAEALGKEINRLIEHPEVAQKIAKQGYESVKDKYTWDHLLRTVRKAGGYV
jgi:glycosyltransferase involved in cell wall biosynthesis